MYQPLFFPQHGHIKLDSFNISFFGLNVSFVFVSQWGHI